MVLGKISKQRYGKIFVQLSNLPKLVFALENPTQWDWETAVLPIFAKLVCSLFTGTLDKSVPYAAQRFLCPKESKLLTREG